ncbi:hypothetical protein [Halorarius litoreus]|uniref:hypothetical protein n=1 Tax=Halorarius litoreus TaxID=2962676 RepID=UPI0020CF1ABB|nr:hypothetical protein [Halorarius litoreus]
MDRAFLATVLAAVVLLVAGIGAGVFLGGTGAFDDRPRIDPAVTGFSAGNVTCKPNPATTPKVDTGNTSRGTFLVLRTNLSLADAETLPTNATIRESGLANYTLTIEPGAAAVPTCDDDETPVVFTQVFFEVPHPGEEPYGVTVTYGDDALFRLRNDPQGLRVQNATGN